MYLFERLLTRYNSLPCRQSDGDSEQKEAVLSYMEKAASRQAGTVNPANIRSSIYSFSAKLRQCTADMTSDSNVSKPGLTKC